MGNTCTPVADSCQCIAKQIQYCKVISLKKKIHGFIYTNRVHTTTYKILLHTHFTFYANFQIPALCDRNFWAGLVISGLFLEAMVP